MGPHRLTIEHEDHAPIRADTIAIGSFGDRDLGVLRAERGTRLEGTVSTDIAPDGAMVRIDVSVSLAGR